MKREPKTLVEAIRYFADADTSFDTMVELRWPAGVHCPTCGRTDVRFIATRKLWECKETHPRRQFSCKVGTIFEDSALPLDKWFVAIWMIANCKNGVSSYELARAIDVTQKSAWHMLHRIRLAMKIGSVERMGGPGSELEADETLVGGKAVNMHASKRKSLAKRRGPVGKAIVMGILERGEGERPSRVRAHAIPNPGLEAIQSGVRCNVEPGSTLYTDAWRAYRGLAGEYLHHFVDHTVEYVNGRVHTNGIENFWSLLKRSIKGTYVSVDPVHLVRYVDEQTFRFNQRKDKDAGRFLSVAKSVVGKRLTYMELTGHAEATA